MDRLVKLTVSDYVYRFYADASIHVFGCTAEDLMADALEAYAKLLSDAIAKEQAQLEELNNK